MQKHYRKQRPVMKLVKNGGTRAPDAVCQVSMSSASKFRRRRFSETFYHIWTWSCDLEHLNKMFDVKFGMKFENVESE